jgi:DNA-binding Xre family transcriptional regulator
MSEEREAAERIVKAHETLRGTGGYFEAIQDEALKVAKAYLALLSSPAPEGGDSGVPSRAVLDVLAERAAHVHREGWTAEHDDGHDSGQMAMAAASYCQSAAKPKLFARREGAAFSPPMTWPWGLKWWKPKDPRRDLVRAGALIIAEIERLDRASHAPGKG